MFYVRSRSGEKVPIVCGGIYSDCPRCGKAHAVDLIGMVLDCGEEARDILESGAYCEECSKAHLTMFEHADKLQAVADRFHVPIGEVQRIVRSGLDAGFSLNAALVGARLALSLATGQQELFRLEDVTEALGCTKEEAAAELEKMGVEPLKLSTLPGFEFLLESE